ncbi:MAG TPA: tetratricopeptide repeat protein [Phycisphaerae bacterium]|mgnify:CR=1 FL=1|nr:tetratricopeptide repeat protein [Phycisphaerae bacterium]
MPTVRLEYRHTPWLSAALALGAVIGPAQLAVSQSAVPTAVQAKRFALRVRLADDSPEPTDLTLWYTRDRGETWRRGPKAAIGQDHIVFEAPGEGLYGFYIVAGGEKAASSSAPKAGTTPQRWVYVDYTPPLAQWKDIAVSADANGARRVAMRWAAHDANLDTRPIALAYQRAGEAYWTTIDAALPNTGAYDWTPPGDLAGRVTFRLLVRDLGGHVVERLLGPISLDVPQPAAAQAPATRPTTQAAVQASPAATRPAWPAGPVGAAQREQARRLYDQGTWHRVRGQYAEAQERYREALEIDPTLLAARADLAGVLYARGQYGDAIREYSRVLQEDPARPSALRGLALAYVARREYAPAREMLERLLLHDEKDAEAWLDLGDVAEWTGDRRSARAHWSKAATVNPAAEDVILKARNRLSLFPPTGSGTKRTDGK